MFIGKAVLGLFPLCGCEMLYCVADCDRPLNGDLLEKNNEWYTHREGR